MLHQTIESAEWKRYNANTRDSYVGDCVKRGLTIAYSMDYDEVGKELNRIKRKMHSDYWNTTPVFSKFVEARGGSFQAVDRNLFPEVDDGVAIRVEDICDSLPYGTYLLLVGEKPSGPSTHLCVVVDGTLFDSWDSRKWFVKKWCVVTESATKVYEFPYFEIYPEIEANVKSYLEKLQTKLSKVWKCTLSLSDPDPTDRYTCEVIAMIRFVEFPPESSKYSRTKSWGHTLVIKVNPRLDQDENIKSLSKKLCQKIYDWTYNIIKDIKDSLASDSFDWEDSKFSGSRYRYYNDEKKLIMNLPEWCRKLITNVYVNDNPNLYGNGYKYEMYMNPLPDDPYPERGEVSFYADTLRELKGQLADYKERGARINYEY